MPTRRKAPRPRNPLAVVTRKLGQKIKPSAKSYKRRPKHKNPRPDGNSEPVTTGNAG